MRIAELIEQLEDLRQDLGDDVEVRLAFQPSWPFEHSIGEIVASDPADVDEDEDEDDTTRAARDDDHVPVVYIGEGRQLGYLDTAGARALGWGRR